VKGHRSVNPGVNWGVATPQIFGRTGSQGGRGRVVIYRIMYRKYCSWTESASE